MLLFHETTPFDIRAGVYKHYKGPLYQVIGYSHNASDDNNVQVLYIGLELDSEKPGPRWVTRDWREFFATVCVVHDGVDIYADEKKHLKMIQDDLTKPCLWPGDHIERFTYMGPIYYKGFET